MKSVLIIHWKDWCWSWNSNTLDTWCEEVTHWKRPWCWERLKVGGERDDRGWDGWMASQTQRTWVWASSRSCWWTGRPGMLQSMGLQRVRHDWATELNWIWGIVGYNPAFNLTPDLLCSEHFGPAQIFLYFLLLFFPIGWQNIPKNSLTHFSTAKVNSNSLLQ